MQNQPNIRDNREKKSAEQTKRPKASEGTSTHTSNAHGEWHGEECKEVKSEKQTKARVKNTLNVAPKLNSHVPRKPTQATSRQPLHGTRQQRLDGTWKLLKGDCHSDGGGKLKWAHGKRKAGRDGCAGGGKELLKRTQPSESRKAEKHATFSPM